MYAIDANVVIEYLLDQERADECEQLMMRAFSGQIQIMISGFNASSIVLALLRGKKESLAKEFLAGLAMRDSVWTYPPMLMDQITATDLMDKHHLDFDDAITLQCAISTKCEALVTFDSDFKHVDTMKIMTPKEVIESMK